MRGVRQYGRAVGLLVVAVLVWLGLVCLYALVIGMNKCAGILERAVTDLIEEDWDEY